MTGARKADRPEHLEAFGYTFHRVTHEIVRPPPIDTRKPGDYGADPLPDGTFRMVPSGDVVDYAERCRRLTRP